MSTATPRRLATSCWAAALAALVAAAPAGAQNNWNFTDTQTGGRCDVSGGNASGIGNTYNCRTQPSGTTVTLTVRAFNIGGSAQSSTIASAAVTGPYSGGGIGVGNSIEGGTGASSPNHALDNQGTGTDFLLLNFLGGAHNLRSVQLGWTSGDSDFQLLRWIGVGAPSPASQTVSQFMTGWQLVGSTNGGSSAATYSAVNADNLASQYWAIAAYNTALGTAQGLDAGDDAVKVLSVTATAQVVPEPSTYMLLATGLGALGMVARRRRSNV